MGPATWDCACPDFGGSVGNPGSVDVVEDPCGADDPVDCGDCGDCGDWVDWVAWVAWVGWVGCGVGPVVCVCDCAGGMVPVTMELTCPGGGFIPPAAVFGFGTSVGAGTRRRIFTGIQPRPSGPNLSFHVAFGLRVPSASFGAASGSWLTKA